MAVGGTARRAAGMLACLVVGSLLLSACSSSSGDDVSFTGSAYPNVDPASTRHVSGPIKSSNVSQLEVAWTLPLTAQSTYGAYSSSPVVSNGVVYSQDLESNVQAIDLDSGEVLWTKKYEQPDQGPNGIVVADGRVYGATPTSAFGLDQETGKQLWTATLARNEHEGIDMAPGYDDGIVYVSTVPGTATEFYKGEGVGILWALDAKTGKKLWKFNTVPNDLWGNPKENSGGGLWYTPTFDGKGSMYFGVGNPGPFPGTEKDPWGSSRPGPNLYTNSIVKLDAKTGKLKWYYQLTPHDLYDWDLQGPAILTKVGGKETLLAAGKSGIVIALDPDSGKLLWKQPVGIHNGHDDDGLYAMRGEYSKLKPPFTLYPGNLGGVIAPISTDGSSVFAPVVNHPVTIGSGAEIQEGGGETAGELVALDAQDGAIQWKHKFPVAPAFGATTSVNDLVFTTTYDGKVYAFDANDGEMAWQAQLPAGTNTGVTVSGDTVIAPAGVAAAAGQTPQIVAYRLGD